MTNKKRKLYILYKMGCQTKDVEMQNMIGNGNSSAENIDDNVNGKNKYHWCVELTNCFLLVASHMSIALIAGVATYGLTGNISARANTCASINVTENQIAITFDGLKSNTTEMKMVLEGDEIYEFLKEDIRCPVMEQGKKYPVFKENIKFHVLEQNEKCQVLKQDERCHILKEDKQCQVLEQNEKCHILKKDTQCKVLEQDEKCKVLKRDEKCQVLKEDETCQVLKNGTRCFVLQKDEICEVHKRPKKCKEVDNGEERKVIEDNKATGNIQYNDPDPEYKDDYAGYTNDNYENNDDGDDDDDDYDCDYDESDNKKV